MLTVQTTTVELMDGWLASDPDRARTRVTFPINAATGAKSSAVVYFELDPGCRLGRHTDSAEETLLLLAGTVDVEVDGERGRLAAGDLALVPAMAPHAMVNVGAETARVVGVFSAARVTSTFEEPVQPFGEAVVEQGAPETAEAPA